MLLSTTFRRSFRSATRHPARPKRQLTIAVAACALLAASCGDGGAREVAELPSLDGATESAAASDDGTDTAETPDLSEAEISRALEEWRDCMLAALPSGSTVEVTNGPAGPGFSISTEEGDLGDEERADEECNPILEDLEQSFIGSPEEIALRQEKSAKVIECLSERGHQSGENGLTLSVDEPTGYLTVDVNDSGGGLDESAYEVAEEECLIEAGFE